MTNSLELKPDFSPGPLESPTGAMLLLRYLPAEARPQGVVQLNHGASEHSGRYREFAGNLARAGFHVFAHDHRAHGGTIVPGQPPHVFGGSDGWDRVIEDVGAVHKTIRDHHPALPLIILGHSMGSMVTLEYTLRHPNGPTAMALLGPALAKNAAMPVLRGLLATEGAFKTPHSPSWLFQKLGWDPLNSKFEPARTPYDWLTRDTAEVDAYIADPECGWPPTMNFAAQLLKGLSATYRDGRLKRLRADMPVLLMSGTDDASTNFGKSVPELERRFAAAGMKDVTPILFEGMRHELHNETGREVVYSKLTDWCQRVI